MKAMKQAHIITVHGTWGGEYNPNKPNWWQPDSRFSGWLIDCLRQKGIDAEIESFKWSGENSDLSRQIGADELFSVLGLSRPEVANLHLITHSHGGNVAEMALMNAWGQADLYSRANLEKIRCVSSVGTPYFRRTESWLPRLPNLAFSTVVLLFPFYFIMAIYATYRIIDYSSIYIAIPQVLSLLSVVVGGTWMLVMFFRAMRYLWEPTLRKYLHPWKFAFKPCDKPNNRWLSIWHPNDEAISALQVTAKTEIERVTVESMRKLASKVRSTIGWLSSLLVCLLVGSYFLATFLDEFWTDNPDKILNVWWGSVTTVFLEFGFYIAAVVSAFLLATYIFFQTPGIAKWLSKRLNSRVTKIIRNTVFGRDQLATLSRPSTLPHNYKGREVCLRDEIKQKMADSAKAKLIAYIEKSHQKLMLVNASSSNGGFLVEAATDLKGGELIHTSYFDYKEIAEMIADHITAHTE